MTKEELNGGREEGKRGVIYSDPDTNNNMVRT